MSEARWDRQEKSWLDTLGCGVVKSRTLGGMLGHLGISDQHFPGNLLFRWMKPSREIRLVAPSEKQYDKVSDDDDGDNNDNDEDDDMLQVY